MTQPLDLACFRDYQKEYSLAAQHEVRGSVAVANRDFSRQVTLSPLLVAMSNYLI